MYLYNLETDVAADKMFLQTIRSSNIWDLLVICCGVASAESFHLHSVSARWIADMSAFIRIWFAGIGLDFVLDKSKIVVRKDG